MLICQSINKPENTKAKVYKSSKIKKTHLLVLVGCDCDELTFPEDVRAKGRVWQLHDITGSDKVEARLILVHRVQNRLERKKKAEDHVKRVVRMMGGMGIGAKNAERFV